MQHSHFVLLNVSTNSTTNTTSSCPEVDPSGLQYIKWIYIIFGECVHSSWEQASFYVGMASLFFWMIALFPQIIANFRNKSASSLALGYLIQSTLGDSCNFIACILSGQLMTQIFVAGYFVLIDIVVIGQYIFYKLRKSKIFQKKKQQLDTSKKQNDIEMDHVFFHEENDIASIQRNSVDENQFIMHDDEHFNHDDEQHHVSLLPNSSSSASQTKLKASSLAALLSVVIVVSLYVFFNNHYHHDMIETRSSSGRKLLSLHEDITSDPPMPKHNDFVFPPNNALSIIGFIIGCICSIMYIGSRIPQLYKNFKSKDTEGLSRIFFSLAITGNICYATSIWLFSLDGQYLLTRIPWLLETHVNVVLDSIILAQIFYYHRHRKVPRDDSVSSDEMQHKDSLSVEHSNDSNSVDSANRSSLDSSEMKLVTTTTSSISNN
ncbi:hypothetical protein C9374_014401 [Naegleria lovaniensis]|uniref:Uncharacterized protein n=1 Tax=Naegleria lovaniensis TaxID=51637 RepID=A0AA88GZR1_NAELO|nr:uncharacterized protein C9374_014401 [Naegleria lovaniensis]KAG2389001.1 hypothetical protein C9374_014401 [Naegleria lovaniensis]